MTAAPIRLGVAGLGRAFMLMRPTFLLDDRVRLVAAADPRPEARTCFAAEFGGTPHAEAAAMCADPSVEAVYVASPHQLHAAHVAAAAAAGRHVLVEKPMATTLADCAAMIAATESAGVHLLVGHSHSHDAPVRLAHALIRSGRFGALRMIHAATYTDFLYRPRRAEELDTAQGGGVVFNQAAHQADVVRLLGGGLVRGLRAATGAWDPRRPTEGAYSALLDFEGGAFASLTYSGYGRYDTDELLGWVGETGEPRDPAEHGLARTRLAGLQGSADEAALKRARAYGAGDPPPARVPPHYNHFGLLVASCEHADLRPTADGVWIYADAERRFEALPPPALPRGEVIDALWSALRDGKPPVQDGRWGMATLELCLGILESARSGRAVTLRHQVPA